MRCLCCNKEITNEEDTLYGWHKRCIKKFFGTSKMPLIDFTEAKINELVDENSKSGINVTGVQKKLSLSLVKSGSAKNHRLTLVDYLPGYILKPQVKEYKCMPEAEHLVMLMAEKANIEIVPQALIKVENSYAYITKRIDRVIIDKKMQKLSMEDFCQLQLKTTDYKYQGSYEFCARTIKKYCNDYKDSILRFYRLLIFNYLIGNSDMHLKNFSLIETEVGSEVYDLSDAYDLLPVNLILPNDTEEVALTLNGKKRNLTKKDFMIFAEYCGIDKYTAKNFIKYFLKLKDTYLEMIDESLLSDDMKDDFKALLLKRMSTFDNL